LAAAAKKTPAAPIGRRLGVIVVGMIAPLLVVALVYVAWVFANQFTAVARAGGTVNGLAVGAPVRILRDDRGVPHIRAASVHDALFAEGYATGSDRLFQIDLTRRYVLGRLSELFGSPALESDENARILDVHAIADREYAHLPPADRDAVQAYADGVNAAATHEPLPPEYHALFAQFEPWRPQDSIAAGIATVLALTDGWNDVIMRDNVERAVGSQAAAAFFSLSDPAYDIAPAGEKPFHIAPLPALSGTIRPPAAAVSWNGSNALGTTGSNAWAAGSALTATGRALIANDPHLDRSIPGVWQLVDIEAPGLHVAGATFAGVPGVVLGHNDRLAWGATNAGAVSPRVYRETFVDDDTYLAGNAAVKATVRVETIGVRFGAPKMRPYLATRHGFVIEATGRVRHAVQWAAFDDDRSPLTAFLALDRATSLAGAWTALAGYPGPTQNFVLGSTDGRVGYTVAGAIPSNADWGLRAADGARSNPAPLHFVPFAELPHVMPARTTLVVTANNLPYGAGYAYRLAPAYTPPYRAFEIARGLRAAQRPGVESSRVIQADTESPAETEFARRAAAALRATGSARDADLAAVEASLASFDGHFAATSGAATVVQRVRFVATRELVEAHLSGTTATTYLQAGPAYVTLMRALREHPRGWFPHDDENAFLVRAVRDALTQYGGRDALMTPYGTAYAVTAHHPFAGFGFHGWDGPRVDGRGGSYAPSVQAYFAGQSFRAVWDVGNWDAGGIDIPLGESGEPGSPHYRDLAGRYAQHVLTPLPFSDAAVAHATAATLVLAP
jgi:penicillin amidase